MKKSLLTLTLCLMFFNLSAQKKVYSKENKKISYKTEKLSLNLIESTIEIPQKEGEEVGLAALIPTAVDLGFKITTSILEKRKEKFSGEYSTQNSYLEAGNKTIPDIEFKRMIDDKLALRILLKAKQIEKVDGYVYYIEEIELNYSKAKTTNKSRLFDYTLEIKPTFFVSGEKKAQELNPLSINSIKFGKTTFEEAEHRTSIIPLPKDGMFSEISVKVVETNPAKVRAEKILEIYNNYKEEAKTIVNNFIKTENSSDSETEENADPNETEGN